MSVNKPLHWQRREWQRLWQAPGGLPHALLLTGPAGIGKGQFGTALVQRFLCATPLDAEDSACGECPSCRLFAAGNHPDFRHVLPEAEAVATDGEATDADKKKASSQILIDQIRALEDFVYIGGHLSSRRAILIEPAEAMNVAAENALLKILEEPPAGVCFVLVASRWRRLLPTIRSRCRAVAFGRPPEDQAREWMTEQGGAKALPLLSVTGGAPIRALEEFEKGRMKAYEDIAQSLFEPGGDFLELAARWESHLKKEGGFKMEDIIGMVQKALFDLGALATTGRLRFYGGRERQAEAIVRKAETANLLGAYGELLRARALASHPLNPRLFLDDVAARYLRAIAPARS